MKWTWCSQASSRLRGAVARAAAFGALAVLAAIAQPATASSLDPLADTITRLPQQQASQDDVFQYPDGWRVNEGRRTSIPAGVHNRFQCAYGPFWPESRYTGGDIGVRYCWRYGGNRIYVKDTNADKAASAVYYTYSRHDDVGVDREGICINSHGSDTWATCQLRVRGQKRKIKLYGALLDRDGNHRQTGLWKETNSDSNFVSTRPIGIECAFTHKDGDRCTELAPNG